MSIRAAGAGACSVAQYLLVETRHRLVVHRHRTAAKPEFRTSIVRGGVLRLDPPGVDVDLDARLRRKRRVIGAAEAQAPAACGPRSSPFTYGKSADRLEGFAAAAARRDRR